MCKDKSVSWKSKLVSVPQSVSEVAPVWDRDTRGSGPRRGNSGTNKRVELADRTAKGQ